jgi:hypothetical protein
MVKKFLKLKHKAEKVGLIINENKILEMFQPPLENKIKTGILKTESVCFFKQLGATVRRGFPGSRLLGM